MCPLTHDLCASMVHAMWSICLLDLTCLGVTCLHFNVLVLEAFGLFSFSFKFFTLVQHLLVQGVFVNRKMCLMLHVIDFRPRHGVDVGLSWCYDNWVGLEFVNLVGLMIVLEFFRWHTNGIIVKKERERERMFGRLACCYKWWHDEIWKFLMIPFIYLRRGIPSFL